MVQVRVKTAITRFAKAIELVDLLAVHVVLVASHSEEVIVQTRAHWSPVDGSIADSCVFDGILHIILIQTMLNMISFGHSLGTLFHELNQRHRGDDLGDYNHNQHCQKVVEVALEQAEGEHEV